MTSPIRILLQTTIPPTANDWSIARFGKLAALLREQRHPDGRPQFDVVARDREALGRADPVLSRLDRSSFDELWLFAVDEGDGLTAEDSDGITRFREAGRGLMVTRDHMDLGCSICQLGGVGKAHHFHSHNLDPDESRRRSDDPYTTHISWPNFHSGANGDFQAIAAVGSLHPVLQDPSSPSGAIRYLPCHPHEGAVDAPGDEPARVIARGRSKVTGAHFNLAVAFEASEGGGRAIAESTFHHFVDYNWDTRLGCPSFVDEPTGSGMQTEPQALRDTHRYAVNIAEWLAGARRARPPAPRRRALFRDRVRRAIELAPVGAVGVVIGRGAYDGLAVGGDRKIGMMRAGHRDPRYERPVGTDHGEASASI